MGFLTYLRDTGGGAHETVHGSDGRLNVSSRTDGRIYYISRDQSEAYTLSYDDANATANDFVCYLKNTNAQGKHLVVQSAGVNCEATSSTFKLAVVTGVQSGGATLTPTNLNRATPKTAAVEAAGPADSNSTPMLGTLVQSALIDHIGIEAKFGHGEFHLGDSLRLGQDEAIAIEMDTASAVDERAFGTIYFYFE